MLYLTVSPAADSFNMQSSGFKITRHVEEWFSPLCRIESSWCSSPHIHFGMVIVVLVQLMFRQPRGDFGGLAMGN